MRWKRVAHGMIAPVVKTSPRKPVPESEHMLVLPMAYVGDRYATYAVCGHQQEAMAQRLTLPDLQHEPSATRDVQRDVSTVTAEGEGRPVGTQPTQLAETHSLPVVNADDV
ncbi:hypothetical protein GCK32_009256 [Trichostrongylus colubriformis]|uniref:Uncharacterized protein n=1 Tax=Trichostrongylus colubriformis TaxID=6319 RepID=A0AAN8FBY6_TRICO